MKGQQVWIATAENALGSYDVDVVADTRVQAIKLCKAAVNRARKRAGYPPYEYHDDIQALPMIIGVAALDMGRAGEVK